MPAKAPPLTLYGLASCDTCRAARKWLDDHDIRYRFHDLRADGLEVQMLERWSDRIEWRKLVNTRSITYRRLPEVDRENMTWTRALATMLEHPTLVRRPVLEHRRFIAVGFQPAEYAAIFARLGKTKSRDPGA
ncbi:MAG TPA: Spx/MgsR family RNA polymerase-binding regulatory protein [Woeseiaceae bacterium]|nr:Spx/MgsR family RNA polymerase-binding regulatory protein [Woeseiaceae bacterium]